MTLNRNFYSFAIFLFGLSAVITLIHGVIYFVLGQQIYSLNSFFLWYLFNNVISLLGSLVLCSYFYIRKDFVLFWITIVVVAAGVAQVFVVAGAFLGWRELLNYYARVNLALTVSWILFGLSQIISNSGKRFWLKLTGIFYLVTGLIFLAVDIWYINSPINEKTLMLEQILKWASLVTWIGPVLLTMNFLTEKQLIPEVPDSSSPSPGKMENFQTAIRLVALLAAIFLSLKFAGDAVSRISWERRLVTQERDWQRVAGSMTFVGTHGDTLKYQLFKPLDFDQDKKYPMVVCLPYSGGVEGAPPAKLLLTEANRKKYPSFLFVPFCPNGSGWGGIPNYPTMDTLVFESIEAIQNENSAIDSDRVYVSGVSRGGYGSWNFISLRPDIFAAAIPVCGGGNPALAPNIVNVAVWAFHGEDDMGVPVSGSRDMIAAIKKSGGNPKYTEFEGAGHDIWQYVTITPGVLDWLFAQKRVQKP